MAFKCFAWLVLAVAPLCSGCSVEAYLDGRDLAPMCPEVTLISVAPLQTGIGAPIDIEANAVDAAGAPLQFRWTAEKGRFERPSAPATTYICEVVGNWSLKLVVSNRKGCQTPLTVPIRCQGQAP